MCVLLLTKDCVSHRWTTTRNFAEAGAPHGTSNQGYPLYSHRLGCCRPLNPPLHCAAAWTPFVCPPCPLRLLPALWLEVSIRDSIWWPDSIWPVPVRLFRVEECPKWFDPARGVCPPVMLPSIHSELAMSREVWRGSRLWFDGENTWTSCSCNVACMRNGC